MNYYSDSVAPLEMSDINDLFYLMIEAKPSDENDEERDIQGAFVNFWIKETNLKSAEIKALEILKKEKWIPLGVRDHGLIHESDPNDPDLDEEENDLISEMRNNALSEGHSFAFYCYDEE